MKLKQNTHNQIHETLKIKYIITKRGLFTAWGDTITALVNQPIPQLPKINLIIIKDKNSNKIRTKKGYKLKADLTTNTFPKNPRKGGIPKNLKKQTINSFLLDQDTKN